ncbi:MAG: UvrB/UvrC motif-containing protein [Phycisphaerales bacterium]|jgi:protein arginine kinase activator|nr:UvrB/UvrC motif-containing protein [Phycisphaerales bacterium]
MTTCDLCDQPAIYHDVRIVNGVHETLHLCQEHAVEAGINLGPIDISVVLNMPHLSQGSDTIKSCPDCGMTIAQYKETSLLGCPTCYETFAEQLEHIIKSVQDNHTQHIGRAPTQVSNDMCRHLQIRRLLTELESAVSQEEYEQAALLRDQLRELHDAGDKYEN